MRYSLSDFIRAPYKNSNFVKPSIKPVSYKRSTYVQQGTVKEQTRSMSSGARTASKTLPVKDVKRNVGKHLKQNRPFQALQTLQTNSHLDPVAFSALQAEIAAKFLYNGDIGNAHVLSVNALKRAGQNVPLAGWVAGLTAWKKGAYKKAALYFSETAESPHASAWMVSASAYWAARSYSQSGYRSAANTWLMRASRQSHTFYGLLATNALGEQSHHLNFDFPTLLWAPESGFEISPALINAIVRQESQFNPNARSYSGAQGLMQLMPKTAKSMAKRLGMQNIDLTDPVENLEIGQYYLQYLMGLSFVGDDLTSLLIAYNAGPGNLLKWRRKWGDVQDPLLFIELIPMAETRAYVERVLANYWIYRMQRGEPTPTMTALAKGQVPRYALAGFSGAAYRVASRH